jgi:hypothetical protein
LVLAILFLFEALPVQAQTPSSVTPDALTPEQIQAFQTYNIAIATFRRACTLKQ